MKKKDMDKYLELNNEFTKKQLVERVVFELEFAVLICNTGSINEESMINDIKGCTCFSKEEYREIINKGVEIFENKHGLKLERNIDFLGKCNGQ